MLWGSADAHGDSETSRWVDSAHCQGLCFYLRTGRMPSIFHKSALNRVSGITKDEEESQPQRQLFVRYGRVQLIHFILHLFYLSAKLAQPATKRLWETQLPAGQDNKYFPLHKNALSFKCIYLRSCSAVFTSTPKLFSKRAYIHFNQQHLQRKSHPLINGSSNRAK